MPKRNSSHQSSLDDKALGKASIASFFRRQQSTLPNKRRKHEKSKKGVDCIIIDDDNISSESLTNEIVNSKIIEHSSSSSVENSSDKIKKKDTDNKNLLSCTEYNQPETEKVLIKEIDNDDNRGESIVQDNDDSQLTNSMPNDNEDSLLENEQSPYYLQNFIRIVQSVQNDKMFDNLFNESDLKIIKEFFELSGT